MRRGGWAEIDLVDLPDELILAHPGWTNDRETLVIGIREAGWFVSTTVGIPCGRGRRAEVGLDWRHRRLHAGDLRLRRASPAVPVRTLSDVLQVTLARMRLDA